MKWRNNDQTILDLATPRSGYMKQGPENLKTKASSGKCGFSGFCLNDIKSRKGFRVGNWEKNKNQPRRDTLFANFQIN